MIENNIEKEFKKLEKDIAADSSIFLLEKRKKSFDFLKNKKIPHQKDEEYKYTPLSKYIENIFEYTKKNIYPSQKDEYIFPFVDYKKMYVSICNGFFEYSKGFENSGVICMDLESAYKEYTDDFISYFEKNTEKHRDFFADMNTIFFQGGVFLKIPKGLHLKEPIFFHFKTIHKDENMTQTFFRNFIIMEENTTCDIVEIHNSSEHSQHYNNIREEIICKKNSKTTLLKIQMSSNETLQIDNTSIIQEKNSIFTAYTMSFTGKIIRNNMNISLVEENTESNMYGIYYLKGKTLVDNHTTVDHKKPNCVSNELYKGVLNEHSQAVFNGKILVQEGAQKTNAYQKNKNILLSPEAVIHTKPQLEIFANDVKCSHGCTIGQLDEEQLFYLLSRGIDKKNATALLIAAFVNDIISLIPIQLKDTRDFLQEKILQDISIYK